MRNRPISVLALGAALAMALLVSGCSKSPSQPTPPGPEVVETAAPTIYRQWWSEIAACLGADANFGAVHWFISRSAIAEADSSIQGTWAAPHHRG